MTHDPQARPTIVEIDGRALARNFGEIARIAGGAAAVLPVVKSNAYGHGLVAVARALQAAGAERFAVATADEGAELRAAGVRGTIVVLGGVYRDDHVHVVDDQLTAVVWDAATATDLASVARARGRAVAVHLKIDTGMSRLGVDADAAPDMLASLRRIPGLTLEGVLTHFCNAESVGGPETARQLERFGALIATLARAGMRPPVVHAANSAATLSEPAARFDWVRPGLALYGVYPSATTRTQAALVPVMRFVTRIVALRAVPAGTGVSYGSTFVTTRPSRIATLPVGYADGYPRVLSNRGVVVVRGERVPVAGRVCMDQTMIDVTAIRDVAVGDEVELWGGALPVDEVAATAGTIAYELLARVGPRVRRVVR